MVVGRILLAPTWPRRVRVFPLAGKFKFMRVRCVLLAAPRVAARFPRELSMESCLVAMSTARGDGMSCNEPQFGPIKVLHRGAIENSSACGWLGFWRSNSQ